MPGSAATGGNSGEDVVNMSHKRKEKSREESDMDGDKMAEMAAPPDA